MKVRSILIACLCISILTSCQRVSRQCGGFDHPLAEAWTGNDGLSEVRSFVNDAGNRKSYSLQSIDKSGPRTNTGRSGSDPNMISCFETARYLYVQSDDDIAYELDFVQREVRGDQPIDSQNLTLVVNTQNPVGENTDIIVRPWFELANLELNTSLDTSEGTAPSEASGYIPEATIGGTIYVDLLQHTFNDNSERFPSGLVDEEAQWVRVLVARDVGLLQYELLNGTVYTLSTN